jgi:hypothetical protein
MSSRYLDNHELGLNSFFTSKDFGYALFALGCLISLPHTYKEFRRNSLLCNSSKGLAKSEAFRWMTIEFSWIILSVLSLFMYLLFAFGYIEF